MSLSVLLSAAAVQAPAVDTLVEAWPATAHADEAFFRPVAAIVTDTDEVWVLDGGNSVIYVFDLDGRPARRIGGRGGGPGEFVSPSLLMEWEDGVSVWDWREQRLTRLDLRGEFLGSRQLQVRPNVEGFAQSLHAAGDTILVFTERYPISATVDRDEWRSAIWRFLPDEREGQRILRVPGREMRIRHHGDAISRYPAPFARASFVAFLGDGGFLYGNSEYARFLRFDASRSVVDTLSLDLPRRAVTPDEPALFRDSVLEGVAEEMGRQGVGAEESERRLRSLRAYLESIEVPKDHPAYLLGMVDAGHLWLQLPSRAVDPFHDLRASSLDGAPARRIRIPRTGMLLEFDPSPHGLVAVEMSPNTGERRIALFRLPIPPDRR